MSALYLIIYGEGKNVVVAVRCSIIVERNKQKQLKCLLT